MQWSFSSSNSQLLSFKSAQERAPAHHKLLSSAFLQRNSSLERQGGSNYPYASWQHNETLNHSPEGRIFPLASQTAPPMVTPASVVPPPNCPVVGSTDLRNSSNISTGPCQLTIFYNGSVCVYDNVSPEKAQAIMLLAGNGDSVNSSAAIPPARKLQSAAPPQQPPNEAPIAKPSLGFSSSISLALPVSVTSLAAVASSCGTQVNPVKPVPVPATHIKLCDASKSSPAIGAARPSFIPSAVPQARKASLARFLEKRKERVVGASPYAVSKNTSECSAAGPGGLAVGTNSVSSSPLPTGK